MRRILLVLLSLALAIVQGLAAESALQNGDIDNNGQVAIADVIQIIDVLLNGSDNMVADVNGDGQVTIADATDLISIILDGSEARLFVSLNSLDFGEIPVGESRGMSFKVWGENTGVISIGGLLNSSPYGYFTIIPTSLPPEGGTVQVFCTATDIGLINGTLFVSAYGAHDHIVNLTGFGVTPPPSVSVSNSSLDFGNVSVGQSKQVTFTVEGTNTVDDISLTLPSTSTNANFTISPETLPASGGTVTVTCFPTSAGEIYESLLVSSNGADDKTVTLHGHAVLGPPSIMVSPTSLNFGTLRRGEIKSMTFTVKGRNLTDNLSVTCDNPEFVVDRTFITPEFAASGVTVIVNYSANTIGDISGTITIAGSGVSSKTVRLTAMCEGNGDDTW